VAQKITFIAIWITSFQNKIQKLRGEPYPLPPPGVAPCSDHVWHIDTTSTKIFELSSRADTKSCQNYTRICAKTRSNQIFCREWHRATHALFGACHSFLYRKSRGLILAATIQVRAQTQSFVARNGFDAKYTRGLFSAGEICNLLLTSMITRLLLVSVPKIYRTGA
jgi:hypothetical protein